MANYLEIKNQHPETIDCFFAFSNEQLQEGKIKANIGEQKIYNGGAGLYGTKEGIKNFWAAYDELHKRISKECIPQEVYNYEFDNHECSYVGDDEEAIKIVIDYFGAEKAKDVNRKCAYFQIDDYAS